MKEGRKKAVEGIATDMSANILKIGPGSSLAMVLLNEGWTQMSDSDRINDVCNSIIRCLMLPSEDEEESLLWLTAVLKRMFAIRPPNPDWDERYEFISQLKTLYQLSAFGNADSDFKFPKFKENFWKEFMEDWQPERYADDSNEDIFSFFLNRFALAPEKEKKVMDDVLRGRLREAKPFDIERLVRWLWHSKDPDLLDGCPEIIRRLAMARASSWRWESLVQDVIGRDLVRKLRNVPIKFGGRALSAKGSLLAIEELTPLFGKAMGEVVRYYGAVMDLVGHMKRIAGEKVTEKHEIVSGERVKIDIYAPRGDMEEVARAVEGYISSVYDYAEESREETKEHYRGIRLYPGRIVSLEIWILDLQADEGAAESVVLRWD